MKLKTCLTAAALAATTVAGANSASAMDYSYRVYNQQIVIDATGEIGFNEDATFWSWFSANAPSMGRRMATAFVFDSEGGNLVGGAKLAKIIYDHRMYTGVAHGGTCASACVLAWAAGVRKSVAPDAHIGVHRPTEDGRELIDPNAAYATTNSAVQAARLFKAAGAPNSVVMAAVTTPSDSIYWLSQDELVQWGAHITW
jgi:hypothetical protein